MEPTVESGAYRPQSRTFNFTPVVKQNVGGSAKIPLQGIIRLRLPSRGMFISGDIVRNFRRYQGGKQEHISFELQYDLANKALFIREAEESAGIYGRVEGSGGVNANIPAQLHKSGLPRGDYAQSDVPGVYILTE